MESLVQKARRLNEFDLDFPSLNSYILRETGKEMRGEGVPVRIPILSVKNNKTVTNGIQVNMLAFEDDRGPFLFYRSSPANDRYIHVIRRGSVTTSSSIWPRLELSTAQLHPVKDDQGRNTWPYVTIFSELFQMSVVGLDVGVLLMTWYAHKLINPDA